jgi:hypothetical protein
MEKKKYIEKVRAQLASLNSSDVADALNVINEKALIEFLPEMARLYEKHITEEIDRQLESMFNHNKYKKVIPVICDLVNNERNPETIKMLISSVWQSGLDYSAHIEVFMPFLKSSDFSLSFEALTVIESNIDFLDDKNAGKLKKSLSAIRNDANENIRLLLDGILEQLK